MHTQHILLLATALASSHALALSLPSSLSSLISKRQSSCPPIWSEIATQFATDFVTNGECNDDARAAIRLSFHDCMAGGKCDGSIILSDECARGENKALVPICARLKGMASEKGVGVADLIQVAGAAALQACPSGPTLPVFIGRPDSSTQPPMGELPSPFDTAATITTKFAFHGFTPDEFVALMGAHTASKNHNIDASKAGFGQDSTPGKWDTKYYFETIDGTAPFAFQSDVNVMRDNGTRDTFARFARDEGAWRSAFVPAMTKMMTLGNDRASLTECQGILRGGTRRRDVRAAPVGARLGR